MDLGFFPAKAHQLKIQFNKSYALKCLKSFYLSVIRTHWVIVFVCHSERELSLINSA